MDINSYRYLLVLMLAAGGQMVQAQLTLEECYTLAKNNLPTIRKLDLIARTSELDIRNVDKNFLPQISFSGHASYQSRTVDLGAVMDQLPIGVDLPSVSKDQYRVQAEVSQLLYDGGRARHHKTLVESQRVIQEQNVESALYQVRSRINSLFFSVLLLDAQWKQNRINRENLQSQVNKMETALENGVAFRSSVNELKAEVTEVDMQATEFVSNRNAFLKMLSLFIGKEIKEASELVVPEMNSPSSEIVRPELKAFELQSAWYELQKQQLRLELLPSVNAFLQGAYGRPTLNMVENKFGPWYVGGLRFNWSLGSLNTLHNRRNQLSLSQKSVEADRDLFLLNTSLDMSQQEEQIRKYLTLLQQDDEVIELRNSVVRSAEAQLHNGVITTHEYIQKVNSEQLARQKRILHQIQLLQAVYHHKFVSGNL